MMRIFKDLDLVEHLGSGIPRILKVYPRECFRFTENFLRMTFPNSWDLSEDEEIEGGQIGSPIGNPIELTERQKEILLIIKENLKISFDILSKRLEIQESAVKKHINILKKKSLLTRIGGTRGYWQVINWNKKVEEE